MLYIYIIIIVIVIILLLMLLFIIIVIVIIYYYLLLLLFIIIVIVIIYYYLLLLIIIIIITIKLYMISNHYQAMAVAYRRRSFSVVQGIGHGGLGMGALPSVPVSGAGPGPWGTIPPMPPVVGAPGCVQRLCPTVDSWADSWDMMT